VRRLTARTCKQVGGGTVKALTFQDLGTLVLLVGNTPAAREWIEAHAPDDASWWAGALVMEPRYVEFWLERAREAGLGGADESA